MSSKVKRLIDKDALIATLKSERSEMESTPYYEGRELAVSAMSEAISIIESAPVITERDTLEDVLERLPKIIETETTVYWLTVNPHGYFAKISEWVVGYYSDGKNDWYKKELGRTPLEAALKLEARINSSK